MSKPLKKQVRKIDWDKVMMWQEIQHIKAMQMIDKGDFLGAFLASNYNPEIEKFYNVLNKNKSK